MQCGNHRGPAQFALADHSRGWRSYSPAPASADSSLAHLATRKRGARVFSIVRASRALRHVGLRDPPRPKAGGALTNVVPTSDTPCRTISTAWDRLQTGGQLLRGFPEGKHHIPYWDLSSQSHPYRAPVKGHTRRLRASFVVSKMTERTPSPRFALLFVLKKHAKLAHPFALSPSSCASATKTISFGLAAKIPPQPCDRPGFSLQDASDRLLLPIT